MYRGSAPLKVRSLGAAVDKGCGRLGLGPLSGGKTLQSSCLSTPAEVSWKTSQGLPCVASLTGCRPPEPPSAPAPLPV